MHGGLGNYLSSEAKTGAIPKNQNSPQVPPLGLYPEQLSGSAFTQPRNENLKTWVYKILPSVAHGEFTEFKIPKFQSPPFTTPATPPSQMRWSPLPEPPSKTQFLEGVFTVSGNGNPESQSGSAIHLYAFNTSMGDSVFFNSDGHMLFVPQLGAMEIVTELGRLQVAPTEIAVVPKGIRFKVETTSGLCKGYICENFGAPFVIPDLGPIGANGLANPRHFVAPQAQYENRDGDFEIIQKFNGRFWKTKTSSSPLNVVGWHGNYWPYKYDLKLFNTINTVSFDHPDPSIFTVLTSPSGHPGLANIDFVIFPPRWMVAENTFRPPYFHRNIMSEFMGLIEGTYDAKEGGGFVPGGSSLHNCFSAHGPDAAAFENGVAAELKPERYDKTLAFMFETRLAFSVTEQALKSPLLQRDYVNCWQGLKKHFKG